MDPIVGGALISGGLGALGSIAGGRSQEKALRESLDFQKRVYADQQKAIAPYRQAGYAALSDLQGLMADPTQIENDPTYQFRLAQGMKAAQGALAARGGLLGGGALRSLTQYGQGMASDEFTNQFNRLASLAGVGQAAATQSASMGQQFGANVGAQMQDFGNIRAGQMLGTGGAITNALNQYMNYNLANRMMTQPMQGYGAPDMGQTMLGADDYGYGMVG